MILIKCPYCLEQRTEEELTYGGEADVLRPEPTASDTEWTEYLYFRKNPKGHHNEQWCCSNGCGQWFKVARNTVSHEITEVIFFDENFSTEIKSMRNT